MALVFYATSIINANKCTDLETRKPLIAKMLGMKSPIFTPRTDRGISMGSCRFMLQLFSFSVLENLILQNTTSFIAL